MLLKKTLQSRKLKVIFKSPSRFINQFHFKDVLFKNRYCGIVYRFKCNGSNAIYYGKNIIFTSEQINIYKFWLKHFKMVKQSAISDHLLACDCNINFNYLIIFSKDFNNINFLLKLSILISRDKLILNKTVKCFLLKLSEWQNLIVVWSFDYFF